MSSVAGGIWGRSAATGALLGAAILGIGGRVAMRGVTLWEGRAHQFTLGGSLTTEMDEPFAIESRDLAFAQVSFEHIEGGGLRAARGLAYIAHVVDMEVDEFAESFKAR